jgi:hypothetical protein
MAEVAIPKNVFTDILRNDPETAASATHIDSDCHEI